jgi:hypothetical protein
MRSWIALFEASRRRFAYQVTTMLAVPKFRKLVESHPYLLSQAIGSLERGQSPAKRLTRAERQVVAVAACRPKYHLTIDSKLGRSSFMREFAKLKQRLAAERRTPLIYFGTVAKGQGHGGYHGHFLLWKSLHYNTLHRHIGELELGSAHVDPITSDNPAKTPFRVVAYVVGQEEPVFGSDEHARHEQRLKSGRSFLRPQARTLAQHRPELLTALDLAKSPAVSDVELYRRCLCLVEEM